MKPGARNKNQKTDMARQSLAGRQGVCSFARVMLGALCLSLAVSCAPKGDFGNDVPSVITDEFLPATRTFLTEYQKKEPVTKFPLTEDESLLRDFRRRIDRDMMYPTVESHYTFAVSSIGFVDEPIPSSGVEFRARENIIRPVVNISEDAQKSPFVLEAEITGDVRLIHRTTTVGKRILKTDELRSNRLKAMKFVTQTDRDNVAVRAHENCRWIGLIHHGAKLRIRRYHRVIDELSLSHPKFDLGPSRQALRNLRAELAVSRRFISQKGIKIRKKTMPKSLLGARNL